MLPDPGTLSTSRETWIVCLPCAAWRLDDALRQYLAERGSKHVALEKVTTLTNGAARLRLAGEAIARMQQGENSAAADGLDAPARLLAWL